MRTRPLTLLLVTLLLTTAVVGSLLIAAILADNIEPVQLPASFKVIYIAPDAIESASLNLLSPQVYLQDDEPIREYAPINTRDTPNSASEDNYRIENQPDQTTENRDQIGSNYHANSSQESSGRIWLVSPQDDLQNTLDQANLGDTIELESGAYYNGPFILPAKEGEGWLTLRTSVQLHLGRIKPENSNLLAKIVGPNTRASIITAPGAHHYKIQGIEFLPSARSYTYGLIFLGNGEESEEELPHDIIIEQAYIHGDPMSGGKRGVALNGKDIEIRDSYFSNWKGVEQDTQAIAGWNGPGPFVIENNYIEASGENIMFGGAPASIEGLVPQNIKIRDNYFSKPLEWNRYSANYDGSSWTIKNVIELKNARDVHIEGNVIENSWVEAQQGYAIVLTPRNQDGTQPWTVVEDVLIENNIIRNAAAGINILGQDTNAPSEQTNHIIIRNNLFTNIGGELWGAEGHLFLIVGPTNQITIDHNTALHQGSILVADGGANTGFRFTNNIVQHNQDGIFGSGTGSGNGALSYFPERELRGNIIVGGQAPMYSAFGTNYFPASMDEVAMTTDYSLTSSSSFKNAGTDGRDIGVDMTQIPHD